MDPLVCRSNQVFVDRWKTGGYHPARSHAKSVAPYHGGFMFNFKLASGWSFLGTGFLALLMTSAAWGAASTQPSHPGKMVVLKGSREPYKGYLVEPKGKGPFPAVIVIMEWWGLNDQIKGVADRLAKAGYV